jgi:hypothetical protein
LGYFGKGFTPAAAFNAFPTFEDAQNALKEWENLPNKDPLKPGGSGSSPSSGSGGGSGGQSDWTNLMTRLAEFGIGAILIIIGINAIVSRTKTYKTVVQTAGGVARVAR